MTLGNRAIAVHQRFRGIATFMVHPGRIVTDTMLQRDGCPIASRIDPGYDARTMSGTATKPKNGKAKETAETEPFHIVVSRGIERFVAQQELSIPKAAEKYGVHPRKLDRLIKQPTPGLIGENFDKICQAFGVTRQNLLELGEPTP